MRPLIRNLLSLVLRRGLSSSRRQYPLMTPLEIAKQLQGRQTDSQVIDPKIGVLLINTGTPDGFDFLSLWRYLRQFLSDPRIVEAPRVVWYPFLYLILLMTRPFKKGPSYKKIWNFERDESPLKTVSRNQAESLQRRLDENAERVPVTVEWAFRYGNPSIEEKVDRLHESGVDRVVVFPLFPQYSATVTAACCDQVFKKLLTQRRQMSIHTVHCYYSNHEYINAVVNSVNQEMSRHKTPFDALVVTYHGIPLSYEQKGDIYGSQCKATTQLIQKHVKIQCLTAFQSKLGPSEWLKPYTDELVLELARHGYKKLLMVAPGFTSDCLETLEELEIDLNEEFVRHGGEQLVYVHSLNDSTQGIDVIEHIVRKEIQGFL